MKLRNTDRTVKMKNKTTKERARRKEKDLKKKHKRNVRKTIKNDAQSDTRVFVGFEIA